MPDKAIDLLDEALSYIELNTDVIDSYNRTAREHEAVVSQREAVEAEEENDPQKEEEKYRKLAELRVQELNLKGKLDALAEEKKKVTLTTKELARVIEIWTGIPASNIIENDFEKLERLGASIRRHIVGQDHAVDAVVNAIRRNRAGVSYKRKPVSFIFAGPTGVGKTELVKTLARELFDSPETLIRLDMSEFMEKFSVSRIIGAPPGYVGYDEAG